MLTDLLELLSRDEVRYVHDFADKLNSEITVYLLFFLSILVTGKTYFLSPIECYTTTSPSGHNLESYVTQYCWSSGTSYFRTNESIPLPKDWVKHRSIDYYPWIPIILFIQCVFFYVPKAFWKEYCVNKAGSDIQNMINCSINAGKASISDRSEAIKDIAMYIETLFHLHRDNRHGLVSDAKRKLSQKCSLIIWGKRSGNSILGTYMALKLVYIANAIIQWFLMIKVLQINDSVSLIFRDVFNHIFNSKSWEESKFFPKVTYCKVNFRMLGSMGNHYTAQCVLPINIFNEKIYILLFAWIFILIVMTTMYFFKWAYLVCFRSPKRMFIKVFLKGKNNFKKMEEPLIDRFIVEFLRLDGIFLLKMIKLHSGELVTSGIIENLWSIYRNKYRNVDLSNADSSTQFDITTETWETKTSMKENQMPSAPKNEMFL